MRLKGELNEYEESMKWVWREHKTIIKWVRKENIKKLHIKLIINSLDWVYKAYGKSIKRV